MIVIISDILNALDYFILKGMVEMKPILAITMGDAAGIGSEITVKALSKPAIYQSCIPVVFGDYAALRDAVDFTGIDLKINVITSAAQAGSGYGAIDMIDFGMLQKGDWAYKKVSARTGDAAFCYVKSAIEKTMAGEYDAIVTGPINKESINLAGHHYTGHTEILAEFSGTPNYAMLLSCNALKVIHVTTHVSM